MSNYPLVNLVIILMLDSAGHVMQLLNYTAHYVHGIIVVGVEPGINSLEKYILVIRGMNIKG